MNSMRCEDAIERIHTMEELGPELSAAFVHVTSCNECRAALRAVEALRSLRHEPLPVADDGAASRAIDYAVAYEPAKRYRLGFVGGMVSGLALAAAIAIVAFGLWLRGVDGLDGAAVPQVHLALNEPQAVTVTLESAEPLLAADVRVELRGAVALDGYDGQRELRWQTDLDRGVNQLTLPVVALDASGGQVLVEVTHGDKRRTFVLDVRAG
jgi:hypothetical protein